MYCLQAVVGAETVLRELAADVPTASVVPLGQDLWLLPMMDVITLETSAGPVAYVEAEYFGGTGSQTVQVWNAGEVIFGPLHLAEGEPSPAAGTPISQALRLLGVTKGSHSDEFDAVRLGRHRDTADWLSPADQS